MGPELSLSLEISIFLFAALLGYFVSSRIGQSIVIGEIIIGIIIGPAFLNIVHYTESIGILAELGAIFLLFSIGLELNFGEVFVKKNAIIASIGVIVPVVMGYGLSKLFGYSSIESLFIGTSLAATSIAITAKVLQDMGKLETTAAKAIIGAAVVDDILSLILLSIAVGLGTSTFSVIAVASKLIYSAMFVAAVVLLRPFVNKVMKKADLWGRINGHSQTIIILALSLAFLYSAIAELIGLSTIVGAFLAGVSLESVNIKSFKEGAYYLEMIFAAIFFVSLGILMDFSGISWGLMVFIVGLILVAFASKIIGCFIPAKLLNFSAKDSLIIGTGMIPRGEVAAIVGLLGLTSGIITHQIYVAILIMALATTMAAPLFFQFIYGREAQHARRS